MAKIVNRDLDGSEQQKVLQVHSRTTVTGTSQPLCVVPFPCQVLGAYEAAIGISGSPTHRIDVLRFIVGTGVTVISTLFNVTPVTALGTSGVFGMSLVGGGSLFLQANDVLFLTPGGAASAVVQTNIDIVVQAIQDIKLNHNLSNAQV
jgi:hypothetical protein